MNEEILRGLELLDDYKNVISKDRYEELYNMLISENEDEINYVLNIFNDYDSNRIL